MSKFLLTPEINRLHGRGFAVHLLHPRSKRPIEMNWSKGHRKTWGELKAQYQIGMNLGVRLGAPSQIGKGYLAVIDCDVKGSEKIHQDEIGKRLVELFGNELAAAPFVLSGRGNGSKHFYVLTESPAVSQRLSQSSEKVRVKMPSAGKPSRVDMRELTALEINDGWRLRAAWEISLMGEGSQVVLPPSIHPDTGREYVWGLTVGSGDSVPFIEIKKRKVEPPGPSQVEFKPVDVDLLMTRLPAKTLAQIISGEGVEDRSAALLGVCNAMLKAGMTDTEILSVLTDQDHFLGQVAFDHAQTENRSRAAEWLRRYTLVKSRRETLATEVFSREVEESPLLPDDKVKEQIKELGADKDWRDLIDRGPEQSGHRPKNTLKNVILILKGVTAPDVFMKDEFAGEETYSCDAPWGSLKGDEVSDIDIVRIKSWLADHWRFEPSDDRINQAIHQIADQNKFHPVRDYLDGLVWDGTLRVDTWIRDYLGGQAPEPYLSAISRKTLAAMIKRIYEPGCKFDEVLILEGVQGVGKSTAIRTLAGDAWFSDAHINIADKDSVLTMRGVWVVELGELSSMKKADVDQLKEFISRKTDRIRVPYGRRTENFPRQCIFIGTTNSEEYLKDASGNRRYWPVKVGKCDFKRLAQDRDQLLAEALFIYELGEPLYLENKEMQVGALESQESRMIGDIWEELIEDWLSGKPNRDGMELTPNPPKEGFQIRDLFESGGPLSDWRPNMADTIRAGNILRRLGFVKIQKWSESRNIKYWVKPERKSKG